MGGRGRRNNTLIWISGKAKVDGGGFFIRLNGGKKHRPTSDHCSPPAFSPPLSISPRQPEQWRRLLQQKALWDGLGGLYREPFRSNWTALEMASLLPPPHPNVRLSSLPRLMMGSSRRIGSLKTCGNTSTSLPKKYSCSNLCRQVDINIGIHWEESWALTAM